MRGPNTLNVITICCFDGDVTDLWPQELDSFGCSGLFASEIES
jgi:hypothetical protein